MGLLSKISKSTSKIYPDFSKRMEELTSDEILVSDLGKYAGKYLSYAVTNSKFILLGETITLKLNLDEIKSIELKLGKIEIDTGIKKYILEMIPLVSDPEKTKKLIKLINQNM